MMPQFFYIFMNSIRLKMTDAVAFNHIFDSCIRQMFSLLLSSFTMRATSAVRENGVMI